MGKKRSARPRDNRRGRAELLSFPAGKRKRVLVVHLLHAVPEKGKKEQRDATASEKEGAQCQLKDFSLANDKKGGGADGAACHFCSTLIGGKERRREFAQHTTNNRDGNSYERC